MHDVEFDHEHDDLTEGEQLAAARLIAEQDSMELLTVGIDIGSSTSHLMFARVVLAREKDVPSSRFGVVSRTVLWRSPILFTPFLPDGSIDAHELQHFIDRCYRDAGLRRADIQSGAVILTGEAIKRKNAHAIDELFARDAGRFVCASAGHDLESILAAHGSGATALSRRRNACGLHVDIGGGTTKLALIDRGEVLDVAAFAIGGRLLAKDDCGAWTRVDGSAHIVARSLGIHPTPSALADEGTRRAIAGRLGELMMDQITGAPLDKLGRSLLLTDPLERVVDPRYVTFSGGVAEYIFDHETEDFGDIGRLLAKEIVRLLPASLNLPVVEVGQRIRATVIGASQFVVEVSGKTVYVNRPELLPLRNVPVIHLGSPLSETTDSAAIISKLQLTIERQGRDPTSAVALAFAWNGPPSYERLHAMALAIRTIAAPTGRREEPLVLVVEADVGQTLGRMLEMELDLISPLIALDGVRLRELDFVDVGEFMTPPGVVPIAIKSLLFLT